MLCNQWSVTQIELIAMNFLKESLTMATTNLTGTSQRSPKREAHIQDVVIIKVCTLATVMNKKEREVDSGDF